MPDLTIEEEVIKLAEHLEHCARILEAHAQSLRGVTPDLTGCGLWNIFCTNLEMAMGLKILTKDQWEDLQK